jgi:hypothetical protein
MQGCYFTAWLAEASIQNYKKITSGNGLEKSCEMYEQEMWFLKEIFKVNITNSLGVLFHTR